MAPGLFGSGSLIYFRMVAAFSREPHKSDLHLRSQCPFASVLPDAAEVTMAAIIIMAIITTRSDFTDFFFHYFSFQPPAAYIGLIQPRRKDPVGLHHESQYFHTRRYICFIASSAG